MLKVKDGHLGDRSSCPTSLFLDSFSKCVVLASDRAGLHQKTIMETLRWLGLGKEKLQV